MACSSRLSALALSSLLGGCAWVTDDELAKRADQDGDGYEAAQFGGGDCDDGDDDVHPDAEELCNNTDDDCNEAVDDVALSADTTFYADLDGDGSGDADQPIAACDLPEDASTDALDCDDGDAAIGPTITEICDGKDQDCDGDIDEDASDGAVWYTDADEDGYGDDETAQTACEAPLGTVAEGGDCDDEDGAIHPYAEETCSETDANCDGAPGSADGDEDGVRGCDGDCDDGDAAISPTAEERCNEIDDDCDDLIDDDDPSLNPEGASSYYPDADGDGFGDAADPGSPACQQPEGTLATATDCDDDDADINPDAYEVCSTSADDDCDGSSSDCAVDLFDAVDAFVGEDDGERAGEAVLASSDLDGDGAADLVVGAPEKNTGKGGVYVVLGVPEASRDLADAPAWKGTDADDNAGASLVAAGDLDGDELGDVLVGAPGGDVAYVLFGPADTGGGLTGSELVLSGSVADAGFGQTLAAGDLNGDGEPDLAFGAPEEPVDLGLGFENASVGAVYAFFGPLAVDAESDDAHVRFQPRDGEAQSYTGRSLASCDANSDGQAELLISWLNPGTLGANPVPSMVILDPSDGGSLDERDASRTFTGAANGTVASMLACGGDVDGDGTEDLLVSDSDESRALLLLGPLSTAPTSFSSADASFNGDADLGAAVHILADLDLDGLDEVLIGGDNQAALWFGAALSGALTRPDLSLEGDGTTDDTGAGLGSGDVDGDGLPDLLVGAPGAHGAAGSVYLVPSAPF